MHKYVYCLLIFSCACVSCSSYKKLVWNDEFDKPGLPDSSKWKMEEGFFHNEEQQYYTKNRTENARVENGNLIIEARKEKFDNKDFDASKKGFKYAYPHADYTSASLTTKGIQHFKYGRIELRAKLPKGKGVWPAFWMLGENRDQIGYPFCGEIDIMEYTGKDPNRIHATIHYSRNDGSEKVVSSGTTFKKRKPFNDFHVYAMEWNKKKIDFYFDKKKYYSFDIEEAGDKKNNPFYKPFYLILNFALGGTWGGTIDDKILPQQFLIDYVRVYQK